eukprot:TRINITY_DN1561_c0_g1_i1.p1 TRINITY_DN1561_c0_g1~~TRINITY_DN1561_c0_g1_i1.p1  ORF type:complete len:409 (+),score=68.46 TRINITY_DN1561_c0_g1_i1:136-1227(+)
MKAHGVAAENIIHFAYDDIAKNSQNPFPGQIFNKPNGNDVYGGCVIDYTGAKVTPQNYLAVLKGQSSTAVPKVLGSTASDTVFLNFADHGAPGLIAFPSSYLYATDLLAAFNVMHQNNMYSKLIYYLEACESGSMFTNLPTDINIYATTAANDHESSWGFYCGSEAVVQGKNIGSCLGDLYSITWMEDVDQGISGETLADQFQNILKRVTKSHPQQYGDKSWTSQTVADWLGAKSASGEKKDEERLGFAIDSRDIKLHYLIEKHANEMSENSMNDLNEEIMQRKFYDELFTSVRALHADVPLAKDTDFDCYKKMINYHERLCGRFTEYGMKYMRSYYDMCQHKKEALPAARRIVAQSCASMDF